jgi:hypothetical protein
MHKEKPKEVKSMQRLSELRKQKRELLRLKRMLDKNACFMSWEGATYAKTLVKLVIIELEIEDMKKDALRKRPV